MAECRNGSDFIRTVMNEIASKQGANRWIDSTPTNIPHMLRISRDFPKIASRSTLCFPSRPTAEAEKPLGSEDVVRGCATLSETISLLGT
jgi:hypothetical protein